MLLSILRDRIYEPTEGLLLAPATNAEAKESKAFDSRRRDSYEVSRANRRGAIVSMLVISPVRVLLGRLSSWALAV